MECTAHRWFTTRMIRAPLFENAVLYVFCIASFPRGYERDLPRHLESYDCAREERRSWNGLLTDQDIINFAIDDHLRTVTSLSQKLKDIRNHLQQEESTEVASRQAQILAAVTTLVGSKESTSKKMEEFETSPQDIVATLQEVEKTRPQLTSEEETSTHREEIIDAVANAVMKIAADRREHRNRESPDGENAARQEEERMKEHATNEPTETVQEAVHHADDAKVEDERQLEEEALGEEIHNEEPNEDAEHLDEEISFEEELEYVEEANSDDEALLEQEERR
ncbi:unnamed protein product [Cylicocyclus nassatus]|uniref:Uncharacterized protein n=1 Tax=Cylicocyclus nassatus TaxID=53992 RepID=A0AA36DS64_CYLNA|nr:unnamed protein product [Cylicocyclus nassatus]